MGNELATVNLTQLPALGLSVTSDIFKAAAKSGSFLERIQLYTKGAAIDNGLIAPGRYGVPSGDVINDLGHEIDILPLCCRVKALDMRDRDNIITNYDPTSDVFQTIEKIFSTTANSACMCGPTFLVFERSSGKFYEFFCGTSSTCKEAPKIGAFLPKSKEDAERLHVGTAPEPCTLKVKYIKKPTYGWHVPVCVPCSAPFTNLPATEVLIDEINKFVALKNSEIEKVEEVDATNSKRRR